VEESLNVLVLIGRLFMQMFTATWHR